MLSAKKASLRFYFQIVNVKARLAGFKIHLKFKFGVKWKNAGSYPLVGSRAFVRYGAVGFEGF